MSMAIRLGHARARGVMVGDPGFLGDFGKAIGGIVSTVGRVATGVIGGVAAGGPIGGIVGGISGLLRPKTSPAATSPTGALINVRGTMGGMPGTGWGSQMVGGDQLTPQAVGDQICFGVGTSRKCYGIGVGGGTAAVGVTPFGPATLPQGTALVPTQNGGMQCVQAKGTHLNRNGYYTRAGYVAPGTRCVKNRRMNPLNPRAVSRAMRRLGSFSRAARCIERDLAKLGRTASRGRSGSRTSSCGGRCKK